MKNLIIFFILTSLWSNIFPSACIAQVEKKEHMVTEENKALIRHLYQEVFVKWNMSEADKLIVPEFIGHEMPAGTPRGPEGFRQFYTMLRAAFPDLSYTVQDIIAEKDKVVVHWKWQATHKGEFFGIPATGKAAPMSGIAIYRISEGKIVERWVELNLLSLLQRLGADLVPGKK